MAGFDILASGPTLLVNGGFEQPGTILSTGSWGRLNADMPGWTRGNSHPYEQVLSGTRGVASSEGSYWLDLEGGSGTGSNMVISQTVSGLAAGQKLILTFDHANRVSSPSGAFEVWWNGALVMTVAATGKAMIAERIELLALDGGGGADLLSGGAGADIFRFAAGDSGIGAAADRISDFLSGTDRIDLSAIDSDTALPGDQAFLFIGSAAFGAVAGQLRFSADGFLEADTDGDGAGDFQIALGNGRAPVAADFIL